MEPVKSGIIMSAEDITRALTRIAREIVEVHQGAGDLILIGIHTRGVYLAQRLQELIGKNENNEILTGDIDITLYRDDWTRISHQPVVQSTDLSFSVDDKQVILVDDVLFTGRTIRAALDALTDFGRPARVELAVLIDRGLRELPIQADYKGKTVPTDPTQIVNVLLNECDGAELVRVEKTGKHHEQ